jgi:hypothetical protein
MIIDLQNSKRTVGFPVPVSGSHLHDTKPTSADVHLYSDPATCFGTTPMLYADCEGLNAGERVPVAHSVLSSRSGMAVRRIVNPRKVRWAVSDDKRTRQFAIMNMYPRLLYTFSDVVVFVLRNPK